MMAVKYTSALRAMPGMGDNESLLKCLRKYPDAFDEVILFAGTGFASRSLAYHQKKAEEVKPLVDKIKAMDIKVGINVHPTLGFFPKIDAALAGNRKHVYKDGVVNEDRLCPTAEENLQYIKDVYKGYASLGLSIVYMDDDVLGSSHCFCPNCLRKFKEKYNVFGEMEATRENLLALIENDDTTIRKEAREAFLQFTVDRTADILKAMEEGVSEVCPEAEIGIMQCNNGMDGFGCDEWVKAMRGETDRVVRMRPGNGNYTEFSVAELLEKANRVGAQIRYMPIENVKLESEIENFPGHALRKSVNFTAFETLMYIAVGCTGTTYSSFCCNGDEVGEYEPYYKMARDIKVPAQRLVAAFGREKTEGVGFWWDQKIAVQHGEKVWPMDNNILPVSSQMQEVGIPAAYNTENAKVILLNKLAASQMSDDEVINALSKAVFMDNEALDELNRRGFGKYTGFKTGASYRNYCCEWQTDHDLNKGGKHKWWLMQGFQNNRTVTVLEKTDDKSEVLTEIKYDAEAIISQQGDNPLYEYYGIGSGIFENELGGRVFCDGALPFEWYYGIYRNIRLKNVLKWLSRDTIPFISSYHRAALWMRGNVAYVANLAMEEIKNVKLSVNGAYEKAEITVIKGTDLIHEGIVPVEKKGNYIEVTLPELPILGSALVKFV